MSNSASMMLNNAHHWRRAGDVHQTKSAACACAVRTGSQSRNHNPRGKSHAPFASFLRSRNSSARFLIFSVLPQISRCASVNRNSSGNSRTTGIHRSTLLSYRTPLHFGQWWFTRSNASESAARGGPSTCKQTQNPRPLHSLVRLLFY